MAHKIHHFKDISIVDGELYLEIRMDRFSDQFNRAQYGLDSMVMTSMIRFMPMQAGTFIDITKAQSAALAGSGKVVAGAAPSGQYLYEGNTMVGGRSRSAWAKRGEKKVLNGKSLRYSHHAHPNAQDHWFGAAKASDGKQWIKVTKKTAGGG